MPVTESVRIWDLLELAIVPSYTRCTSARRGSTACTIHLGTVSTNVLRHGASTIRRSTSLRLFSVDFLYAWVVLLLLQAAGGEDSPSRSALEIWISK